jgi:hypothetical protein
VSLQNKSFHGKNIMKILVLIIAVFALLLTGCSSTYKVSDFSTKDQFYGEFNKFADNKNLKITLTNDSSFIAVGKTKISDDTLIIRMNITNDEEINIAVKNDVYKSLPLNKIKEISYKNHWLGIPFGFLDGLVIGTGVGIIVSKSQSNQTGKNTDLVSPIIIGATGGSIIGIIAGWFVGQTHIYQFNP